MSRAMDTLAQAMIDDLTQLLRAQPEEALNMLRVIEPVLLDSLNQVKKFAVDRRDISGHVRESLAQWLKQNPQPTEASQALLNISRQMLEAGRLKQKGGLGDLN